MFPNALWVHGGARGFDAQVQAYSEKHGFRVARINAPWDEFGKRAGPIRNRWMLDLLGDDDIVVCCWDGKRREGSGTWDCMTEAERRKFRVIKIKPAKR